MRMIYDFYAAFYLKATDTKARFLCPIGLYRVLTLDYFSRNGFSEVPDNGTGYADYVKDIEEEALQDWVQDGYDSEVLDVIYSGKDFERIELRANELEVLDEEDTITPRGFYKDGIFVEFEDSTEYKSLVRFIDGDPFHINKNTRIATIHLGTLERYFKLTTQNEVMKRIRLMRKERWNSFDELQDWLDKVKSKEPEKHIILTLK